MLPSFLSMETITRGLYIQQLNQQLTASNLANPSQDANGYLMNSIERLNTTTGSPYLFGNPGGNLFVGSGPLAQTITRLRDSFLDSQIQRQSSVVGKDEIMNSVLAQLNTLLNGTSGTVDQAVTNLANAFAALAPNPSSVALRSAVVNAGVAFASLTNGQFTQMENMQDDMGTKIQGTVRDINAILQQLSSVNKQLLATSQGIDANSLLDARDYALDRLSRLIGIQSSFGTAGTVSVFLAGSSLSLVDGAGAAILQTSVNNGHNPELVDVTIQSSEGTVTLKDPASTITGGNLAGELYARDVVLEGYKSRLDQITTSVMNVTNIFHGAGYAADGVTTGNVFFTGTGAQDINVNAALVTDPTRTLLATSSTPFTAPATGDGEVAQFIGNIRNLLANNFVESNPAVSAGVINPTLPIGGQPFTTLPNPAGGSFTINGNTVNWTTGNTVDDILNMINAADPTVQAVFNAKTKSFFILSSKPITIIDTAGNFTLFAKINNVLVSTIRMNNSFAPTDPSIVFGFPLAPNSGLNSIPGNSYYSPGPLPVTNPPAGTYAVPVANIGGNLQAFRVTPSLGGTFSLNGVPVTWFNSGASQANNPENAGGGVIYYTPPPNLPYPPGSNAPLNEDLNYILGTLIPGVPMVGTTIIAQFSSLTQTITLRSVNTPKPIQITDVTGNFTVFTGLNGDVQVGNLSSSLQTQISTDLTDQNLLLNQDQAQLTQLNNAQANVAGVSTTAGQPGVPIAVLEQQAMQSLIAYNASLQVLQIQNQMFSDLISAVSGGTTSSGSGSIVLQGR